MGFFSGVKNTWKVAEAAAVIQTLLEHQQQAGMFDLNPAKIANAMVVGVWNGSPETYDGRRGARPHKASVAAAALIASVGAAVERDKVDSNILAMSVCLAQILTEIEEKAHFYNFNHLDGVIIASVMQQFEEIQLTLEGEASEAVENMANHRL